MTAPDSPPVALCRTRSVVLLAVTALGTSCVMTQLALMRELLCAFNGNELVLGIILGNWLLLTGLGASLGRTAERIRDPVRAVVWCQLAIALLPLAQVFAVRTLRNVLFIRGAAIGLSDTILSSFVLLLPYGLVSGYFLTLACSFVANGRAAAGIGKVYVADSLGSVAGGIVFTFVLIRLLDHISLLCGPALLNLLLAGLVAVRCRKQALFWLSSLASLALVGLISLEDLDDLSTRLQYPRQHVVFRANSPYGRLVVTEAAGQFNFVENGLPVLSTHEVERIEETVHYALAQRPDAREVLLISGGLSGTAKEILKHRVRTVTYVELDPVMIELGRRYLPTNLADARIKVVNADGRRFVKQTSHRFDVIIVDVPDPSTSQINRFYTAEFFAEVKGALAPHGVLSFSLGHYENYVSDELARLLASADRTLKQSFAHVLVLPGGRVFFLASDGELGRDIAARLAERQIATQLITASYLEAMFAPDRLADIERAVSQPASLNTDFSPVLYYYHLVYWMSQFSTRGGLVAVILGGLLVVFAVRLNAVGFAVWASGFAASALEVVLLLSYQILYGSLYQQVGVVVTVFMAGLALGAFLANRPSAHCSQKSLSKLALLIALYGFLLPPVLVWVGRLPPTGLSAGFGQAAIPTLTLVLATLVGMEFPVASRVECQSVATTAGRLYTADFLGASVGALLAGTLLIPLVGVTAVCLLTAALNLACGVILWAKR